ncbi:hypothetical protein TRIP_B50549 [uncultured Desulfatiglans sp.]|uniref:Uncharacterized protein n=1 Tax=Uncultured Desulfatiglans sp. TaxID=1748965 RepID=A0A653AI47_UNCDX|nr:hypothetical protein TRIP_B50549 [uncultured Desulfatiglans sp.]
MRRRSCFTFGAGHLGCRLSRRRLPLQGPADHPGEDSGGDRQEVKTLRSPESPSYSLQRGFHPKKVFYANLGIPLYPCSWGGLTAASGQVSDLSDTG